jgi:hypothetical protein
MQCVEALRNSYDGTQNTTWLGMFSSQQKGNIWDDLPEAWHSLLRSLYVMFSS